MLQNVTYANVTPDVQRVFESYFSNNAVTMGTLCRKIKRILSSLATTVKGTWEVVAKRETGNTILIEMWYSASSMTISIEIQPFPAHKIKDSMRQVEILFGGNSTNPKSKGLTTIKYPKECLEYLLYRYPSEYKLFYLKMEYREPNVMQRFINSFGKKSEIIVISDEVDDIQFRRKIRPLFN